MWMKLCRWGQEPADEDKTLRMTIKILCLRLQILLCSSASARGLQATEKENSVLRM